MMHYWHEVLKVMEITGRNPSSRIKDSQIRGRSPSVWEFFFLLQGFRPVISITQKSGIDVGQGITEGPGKFVKKNKRRALNKCRA